MFISRIDKIKSWVKQENIDYLFVEDPLDLYYLTGLSLSLGRLLVCQDRAILFVDGRYFSVAKKDAPCDVCLSTDLKSYLPSQKTIGFDSHFLSYDGFLELQKSFPSCKFVPVSAPLKTLRMIKDGEEIKALRRAQHLTFQGYEHIVSLLKEGVSEEALGFEFEVFCRKRGASRLSFSPIVAFNENSAYPHHRAGKTKLKNDSIVLFDLGAVVDGYAGDMTRVHFFGRPNAQLFKDYALIQKVQKMVISHVAPGIKFGELDRLARRELEKEGVEGLFTHGLSHGIGLDVHEFPRLRKGGGDYDLVLREGMAFTVEPGLYREGIGGVRYEDVVIVTKDGYEEL
jgi:Xaa-Pro aminopeptidase